MSYLTLHVKRVKEIQFAYKTLHCINFKNATYFFFKFFFLYKLEMIRIITSGVFVSTKKNIKPKT